jgi:hypothetical protein
MAGRAALEAGGDEGRDQQKQAVAEHQQLIAYRTESRYADGRCSHQRLVCAPSSFAHDKNPLETAGFLVLAAQPEKGPEVVTSFSRPPSRAKLAADPVPRHLCLRL